MGKNEKNALVVIMNVDSKTDRIKSPSRNCVIMNIILCTEHL